MKWKSRSFHSLPWMLGVLLLAACNQASQPETPTPTPTAIPTVVSDQVQPAEFSTAPPEPEPTGSRPATPSVMPETTPGPPASQGAAGPLPAFLARIPLAPEGAQLFDLLLDSASERLYVTDTSAQLHILDSNNYQVLATLPAAGRMTLDPSRQRLYVSPDQGEGDLSVVDTENLVVMGSISPGGRIALDSKRGHLYVGSPIPFGPGQPSGRVRIYDAETLSEVGQIPQPGIPIYNPLRDELYVVAYTVYVVDLNRLAVTGDLLPEIAEQSPPWCNGCLAATDGHIDLERNLLTVEVTTLSAGKGPGSEPPPRFFDATTLDELGELAYTLPVERGCWDRLILAEPVKGRIYRGEHYSRYVSYNNLLVSDQEGNLQTWRDGLGPGITNPNTGQMYLPHGDNTLVLDLAELAPAGTLPPLCVHTLDTASGQIYAFAGPDLAVLSETGGWSKPPATGQSAPLPDDPLAPDQVALIQPSPDYAQDQTLFMTTASGRVYRSSDAGQNWVQLQGGLPTGPYLTVDLAISPDFANDQTLFAAGARREFWGEGVYRSTDGGDTWQPVWKNLMHLRVYDVSLSSNYAADGTLLAYSNYQRITPWQSGASIFRSSDRGLSWSLVMTATQASDLPLPASILPADRAQPLIQFRQADYGHSIERTINGGATWTPLDVARQPGFLVQAIAQSPTFAVDHTLYVLSEFQLYRSTDGGQTWESWQDERLVGRDYTNKLATAATSPVLPGGGHRLLIGTHAGEFWNLDPEQMNWEAIYLAEPWPRLLEGTWVGGIETAPNGDVWLGTWGDGLARYAEGEIQARFAITDGLPTQYISAVAVAPDGALWAGGDLPPGVASFDGERWTPRPFTAEDSVGAVHDIAVDPNGAIWAGARAPGLLRWNGQKWELISDTEGLTGWRINDIEFDSTGTIWAATAGGLVFYSQGGWSGAGDPGAIAVEVGPQGTAYLLLSDGSVWRFAGGGWLALPPLQEGQALNALALHVASDGAVWVGTHAGAFRYDGQTWRQFTTQDGLPANDVPAISQDAAGWMWFGTSDGAARVDPATLGLSPVEAPAVRAPTPLPPAPTVTSQCVIAPSGPFSSLYAAAGNAEKFGCPTAGAAATGAAYQPLEYGVMFWRADENAVYVLEADGRWASYADTWDSTQPPADPALKPPEGLSQPVRGFGKVWREQLDGPEASIGWGLAEEQGYEMLAQPFAGGQMFLGPGGEVYALYTDDTWQSKE